MNYKDFVSNAMRNYDSLPQETNELYRNHYVRIPDLKEHLGKNGIDDADTNNKVAGVKFDTVISSSRIQSNSDFITIKDSSKLSSRFLENAARYSTEDKYAAFINAHSKSTLFVNIPSGINAKVSIRFVATAAPLNIRVVINVGKGASLNLLELHESTAQDTVIGVLHDTELQDNAIVEINALHNESNNNTTVLGFFKAMLGKGANLKFNAFYNGGSCVRVRNFVEASAQNGSAEVNEMVLGSTEQKFDIDTHIVNAAPDTKTKIRSRVALMDASRCVLKGFAKITKGAERSDSRIHERSILLDKEARVDCLPDMSVDENSVKATHSSATAPIDVEKVFYLMSKGMDEKIVRKLIMGGFFAECLEKMDNAPMRDMTLSLINCKLDTKDSRSMQPIPASESKVKDVKAKL